MVPNTPLWIPLSGYELWISPHSWAVLLDLSFYFLAICCLCYIFATIWFWSAQDNQLAFLIWLLPRVAYELSCYDSNWWINFIFNLVNLNFVWIPTKHNSHNKQHQEWNTSSTEFSSSFDHDWFRSRAGNLWCEQKVWSLLSNVTFASGFGVCEVIQCVSKMSGVQSYWGEIRAF